MIKNLLTILLLAAIVPLCYPQAAVKVIDAETGDPLPYADILIDGTEYLITNSEGIFAIPEKYTADEIDVSVSFLGYRKETTTLGMIRKNMLIVKLQPGFYELEGVYISRGETNADSIIAKVKRRIGENYKNDGRPTKNTLFYRTAAVFKPRTLDVIMTKSSGYKKEELHGVNSELKNFTSALVARPPQEFADMLCNYYTANKTVKGKQWVHSRFKVVKAVKLKDANRAVSITEIEQAASGMLFKHLDSTRFYRIKSGLFGSRDTIVLRPGYDIDGKKVKHSELNTAKSELSGFRWQNDLAQSNTLDFINKSDRYQFSYEGAVPADDGELIYIIKFIPDSRKAKFAGTLYISEKDYAVVRCDYALADGRTLGGVNLKFLLGVKESDNLCTGVLIYKHNKNGNGYYLQYAAREEGQYIYIHRPLKFIEITKGDKDVVAFDLKLETSLINKSEYFNIAQEDISESTFDAVKEEEFRYMTLNRYQPGLWKEYINIEPVEEMKKFRAAEQ